MTTTNTLSENAAKLLAALKIANVWEESAIRVLFPKPQYISTMSPAHTEEQKIQIQSSYWQDEVNVYGHANERPVNGTSVYFTMDVEKCYADTTREAFIELKNAGLAVAKNAGYNTYYYQYTGK